MALMLVGFISSFSWSAELKRLDEILKTEDSPQIHLYGMIRCSAVYIATAGLLANSKIEKFQKLKLLYEQKANEIVKLTIPLISEHKLSMTNKQVTDRISRIVSLYDKKWKSNFAATGHNMGGLTIADIKTCKTTFGSFLLSNGVP